MADLDHNDCQVPIEGGGDVSSDSEGLQNRQMSKGYRGVNYGPSRVCRI